ncbi:MAG: PorT family protein [Lewinellaceae bacterium]|nr:PorT family protein [Phaeodactylibacter sp.]MCB9349301.1 PorT family protein [Lewinellaceae bacterium]
MKKALLFLLLVSVSIPALAQVKLGLKLGLSSTQLDANEIDINGLGGNPFLKLNLEQARFGIHAGAVIQAQLGAFLLQPEILFNSNRVDYRVEDLSGSSPLTSIRTEKYQYLDIPLLLGVKAKPFRFQAGPEAHIFINSSSELSDFSGYEQKFEQATFGWLASLGLDVWNLMLDIRYEGNFSKFGDHITFNGQPYSFDKSRARILASVGILFGK